MVLPGSKGRYPFQKVITMPSATIIDPPPRIGVVRACPNRTFATTCVRDASFGDRADTR